MHLLASYIPANIEQNVIRVSHVFITFAYAKMTALSSYS